MEEIVKKTNHGISAKASRIGFNECKDKFIKLIDKKINELEKSNPKYVGLYQLRELKEELNKLKPKFAQ